MEIKVEGMMCGGCAKRVTNCLESLGCKNVKVDLVKKTASFDGEVDIFVLKEAIEDLGFDLVD